MPGHKHPPIMIFFMLILAMSILIPSCTPVRLSPTRTSTPDAMPSPEGTPGVTELPSQEPPTKTLETRGCPPVQDLQLDEIEEIERQVSRIRGLYASEAVVKNWLPREEVAREIVKQYLDDLTEEEAVTETRLLVLLGLIPEGTNLRDLHASMLQEQVAGYYDSDTGEMTLVCDEGFDGLERVTYAHEFVHALQDQEHDFERVLGYDEAECEADAERCLAIRSILEGDASLLQEQWLRTYATEEDLTGILEYLSSFEMPVYKSAPGFIQDDFTFPYMAGLQFIRHYFLKGEWAAIDGIYNDPPVSTEQIMHPNRYPEDIPVRLSPPETAAALGGTWEITGQGQLGEWRILSTLDERLFPEDADRAAEGWGGDVYQVLVNKTTGQTAFVLLIQWDTMRDSHEFATAFREYGDDRFGDPDKFNASSALWEFESGVSQMERVSNQTLWVIAPDKESLSLIWNSINLPMRTAP
jgi:hypothetical protein